jgi:sulfur carrier protein ThiS
MKYEIPSRSARLTLGGHLSFYDDLRRKHIQVYLEKPAPLSDLLSRLGIPWVEISFASVNGELASLAEVWVAPGDRIELYPPMGGG